MSNKPVLFIDFDGTICHDRYWRSLPSNQHKQVQKLLFGENAERVNKWMRGKCTAEEINEYIAIEIGSSFKELWATFKNDCMTMRISKEILQKLKELRNKYILVLITANMDSFSRFTVPSLNLFAQT